MHRPGTQMNRVIIRLLPFISGRDITGLRCGSISGRAITTAAGRNDHLDLSNGTPPASPAGGLFSPRVNRLAVRRSALRRGSIVSVSRGELPSPLQPGIANTPHPGLTGDFGKTKGFESTPLRLKAFALGKLSAAGASERVSCSSLEPHSCGLRVNRFEGPPPTRCIAFASNATTSRRTRAPGSM